MVTFERFEAKELQSFTYSFFLIAFILTDLAIQILNHHQLPLIFTDS